MWPFSNPRNAMEDAMPYLDKIEPMLTENYSPYLQGGMDPSSLQNQWMSDFNQSPGQKMAMDAALRQQRNYARGQGMMGTPSQQLGGGRLAAALQSDQMQQYFNNNKSLFDTGLGATQGYTGDLSNLYGTESQLAYNNAREKNKGWNDILQGLLQGAGGAAMGYATGGPGGAALGALGGFSGGYGGGDKGGFDLNKFGQLIRDSKNANGDWWWNQPKSQPSNANGFNLF